MKIQLCESISVNTKNPDVYYDSDYNSYRRWNDQRREDWVYIKQILRKYISLPKVKKHGKRYLGETSFLGWKVHQYYNRITVGCKIIPLKNVELFLKHVKI